MDGTGNRYVQRNKSDSERQTQHAFPHMGTLGLNLCAYVHMCMWGGVSHETRKGPGEG